MMELMSGPDSQRRPPVQFVRVWVVLVVLAAGLELTTRTSYQRVMLAAILLMAIIIGAATFRRFGMRRGPLPQRSPQKLTAAAFLAPMLCVAIGYAGRFTVVPDIDDRSSFWAGIAGFLAGTAVAYPVIWLYRSRRRDRGNVGDRASAAGGVGVIGNDPAAAGSSAPRCEGTG